MKKIFTYALVMMMSMMSMTTLTSCNTEDEIIADYLTYKRLGGLSGRLCQQPLEARAFSDGQYMTVWHFELRATPTAGPSGDMARRWTTIATAGATLPTALSAGRCVMATSISSTMPQPYANGYWARTRGADGTDAEGVPVVVLDDGKCVLRGKFAEEYLKNTSFACTRR